MEIIAKFTSNKLALVDVTITHEKGSQERKSITFQDFIECLSQSKVHDQQRRIGHLPRGFYDGMISVEREDTFSVVVTIPKGVRSLCYYETTYFIPFPTLILSFEVINGKLVSSRIFAITEDNPRDTTPLYSYPYGNVYSDGRICWGGNYIDGLRNMQDADRVVQLFFGSPTNDDLWESSRCINGEFKQQRELLEFLKEKPIFPENLLVRCERATMKNLVAFN